MTRLGFSCADTRMLFLTDGAAIPSLSPSVLASVDTSDMVVLPGFCDVHVHLREPGFSYKETVKTGCAAAARGGYTALCTMPNLSPVPDSVEHLEEVWAPILRDASVTVRPYGAITVGQRGECLSDLAGMADRVIAFSDDGRGVQSDRLMRSAMEQARALGKMIVAHCEDNRLLGGGYIHDGDYARAHGHRGICSESEWGQIRRDLELVRETGVSYHVCHVSTAESVELIRRAKAEGLDVTCETAPHYLTMDDSCLQEHGRFKMNPPLRSRRDREALVAGLLDGTVDMIATDHAPHSLEEKAKGLAGSAFGVVGLETAFPALYTHLVKEGILSLSDLVRLLCIAPRARFGIPYDGSFSVWNLSESFTVDPSEFLSCGRATPYEGETLFGVNHLTVYDGNVVYKR